LATQLPRRRLGKTGIEVTTLGLGCGPIGRRPDNSVDEAVGLETVVAALDAGVRLLDTASLYLDGVSERLVGEALRQRPALKG
jgi:aryl-alcohol dehydrogenase-like predicted oxidoreductase